MSYYRWNVRMKINIKSKKHDLITKNFSGKVYWLAWIAFVILGFQRTLEVSGRNPYQTESLTISTNSNSIRFTDWILNGLGIRGVAARKVYCTRYIIQGVQQINIRFPSTALNLVRYAVAFMIPIITSTNKQGIRLQFPPSRLKMFLLKLRPQSHR